MIRNTTLKAAVATLLIGTAMTAPSLAYAQGHHGGRYSSGHVSVRLGPVHVDLGGRSRNHYSGYGNDRYGYGQSYGYGGDRYGYDRYDYDSHRIREDRNYRDHRQSDDHAYRDHRSEDRYYGASRSHLRDEEHRYRDHRSEDEHRYRDHRRYGN